MRFRSIVPLTGMLLMVLIAILLFRQTDQHQGYPDRLVQAQDPAHMIRDFIPAKRGRILDRSGKPLVDNHTFYHVGVVLADLEATEHDRRLIPLWRLDGRRFDALVGELAVRLERSPADVREALTDGLIHHPAVAIRHAARVSLAVSPTPRLGHKPVSTVSGSRDRIYLIQGEAPDRSGLFTQVCSRLAAALGVDPPVISALIERHASSAALEAVEREFEVPHVVFAPQPYVRLCDGLANELTRLGMPTARSAVERALAHARTTADDATAGSMRFHPISLIERIPYDVAVQLAARSDHSLVGLAVSQVDAIGMLPGLALYSEIERSYPAPGSASHLLGSVSRHPDPEASGASSWEGTSGLELRYNEFLRGVPGRLLRVRRFEGQHVLEEHPPRAGSDVVTELDLELQQLAETSLSNWLALAEEQGTATAAMKAAQSVGLGRAGFALLDCHSGAILALASSPGYDLAARGARHQEQSAAPGDPLHNYATMPEQPPGSMMYLCTALAGMEQGVLDPGESIHSLGYMALIRGQQIMRDQAPPGDYDLTRAIQLSSQTYFATLAQRIGGEKIAEVASRCGLGRVNAQDVSDQEPGILPSPSTIARVRPHKPRWLPLDNWTLGIGQFLTASPLQMAGLAAVIANGGQLVSPYLVTPVTRPTVQKLSLSAAHVEVLRRAMTEATRSMHGPTSPLLSEGRVNGDPGAAFAGTSKWGSEGSRASGTTPDHAWMVGYAPAQHPTIAFALFIHSGTSGEQACGPVVKRILERYFAKYGSTGHRSERK